MNLKKIYIGKNINYYNKFTANLVKVIVALFFIMMLRSYVGQAMEYPFKILKLKQKVQIN